MPETRILLVTYVFPPCGGVIVQRALGMARYLPAHGVRLSVLTAKNPISQHGLDPSLASKIHPSVKVFHADSWEPPDRWRQWVKGKRPPGAGQGTKQAPPGSRGLRSHLGRMLKVGIERVLSPDPQVLWARAALPEVFRIIEQEQIPNIVLTVPPFSLLTMANAIRARFPKVRIVLDFRDDWLNYHLVEMEPEASAWKRSRAAHIEANAVRCSDVVTTVTETWAKGFAQRYPDQNADKFITIPNGFDHDLVGQFKPRCSANPPLIVGYFGTVYANGVYSPANYLDALDGLPEEVRQQIETRFIGRIAPDAEPLFGNRRSSIVRSGFLPQAEGFEKLAECHVLLLIVANKTVHSAKLFEYLAMGIPILAISPQEGEVGQILRKMRAGWCVDPSDISGIQMALQMAHRSAFDGEARSPVPAPEVMAYSRQTLMGEFVEKCQFLKS